MGSNAGSSIMTTCVVWEVKGAISVNPDGALSLPDLPRCPGLYRITLADGRFYIGETSDIRRRLNEYRSPTQGTESEHVLNQEIKCAGGGEVAIFQHPEHVDRRKRRALERQEIDAAIQRNEPILNRRWKESRSWLQAKLRYHEGQAQKVRTELETLEQQSTAAG
jgi:hypothetical protein